ncbi:hypothetical protein HUJ04_011184 [Dendroctonus ponderosae]|nr:hypothetical protein HUJ04_011184 [Dendroctonus ponderosae]
MEDCTYNIHLSQDNRNDCVIYRAISVTSTMSVRANKSEYEEEEEQSGFKSGRSCADNVFTMKQMIEKRSAVNLEIHIFFINLTKAYDSL